MKRGGRIKQKERDFCNKMITVSSMNIKSLKNQEKKKSKHFKKLACSEMDDVHKVN